MQTKIFLPPPTIEIGILLIEGALGKKNLAMALTFGVRTLHQTPSHQLCCLFQTTAANVLQIEKFHCLQTLVSLTRALLPPHKSALFP